MANHNEPWPMPPERPKKERPDMTCRLTTGEFLKLTPSQLERLVQLIGCKSCTDEKALRAFEAKFRETQSK